MKSSFIYFVEDTETSFVLNDLRQIAKKYDRVILLSAESIDNKNELPENTEVFENFINWKQLNIKQVFLSNFFSAKREVTIVKRAAKKGSEHCESTRKIRIPTL